MSFRACTEANDMKLAVTKRPGFAAQSEKEAVLADFETRCAQNEPLHPLFIYCPAENKNSVFSAEY